MKEFSKEYASARVPDDVIEWPGSMKEILKKLNELNDVIESLATGKTQPWR
uniref:Uncharacterized protein n=1 Tax=viral metagenome TaxID=1070528 RepID=A0A6M3M1J6_9ZZZZ